jgi:hypothetical protein
VLGWRGGDWMNPLGERGGLWLLRSGSRGLWGQLVTVLSGRLGYAHADLSAYNLLVHGGPLVIIGLPRVNQGLICSGVPGSGPCPPCRRRQPAHR